MRIEKSFCDLCDRETKHPSVITIKWINSKRERNYDICNYCREKLEATSTDGYKEEKLFLNILKNYGAKLFKHYAK